MQSYIIIGKETASRTEEIGKHLHSLGISPFDTVTLVCVGPSIGIGEAKAFIKSLSLLPESGKFRAGIIENAHLLTTEAQQSLLKTLEEPPPHAYIFLGVSNATDLLPTIVSRCMLISAATDASPQHVEEDGKQTVMFVTSLLAASPGKKIHLLSSIGSKKEDYVAWIDRTITHLRTYVLAHPASEQTAFLGKLLRTKQYIGNNVHPLLLIEHAVLAASRTIE